MIIRSLTIAALLALLVACSAETPERSSSSTSSHPDRAATESVPESHTAESQGSPERPDPGPRLLTPDGWGRLRIGMSRAQVVAAAGDDADPEAVGGPDPETCDEFRPRNAPEGVLVMIQEGVLTRISVSRNPDITTPTGFRVGDSGSTILAEHGAQARVQPHQYWQPPAKYITVWRQFPAAQSERRGIRYEINAEDKVVHLRGGGPSIEFMEGCV